METVPVPKDQRLLLLIHSHEVRDLQDGVELLLLLRVGLQVLSHVFIDFPGQLEVLLGQRTGPLQQDLKRIVLLDPPHHGWIVESGNVLMLQANCALLLQLVLDVLEQGLVMETCGRFTSLVSFDRNSGDLILLVDPIED